MFGKKEKGKENIPEYERTRSRNEKLRTTEYSFDAFANALAFAGAVAFAATPYGLVALGGAAILKISKGFVGSFISESAATNDILLRVVIPRLYSIESKIDALQDLIIAFFLGFVFHKLLALIVKGVFKVFHWKVILALGLAVVFAYLYSRLKKASAPHTIQGLVKEIGRADIPNQSLEGDAQ